MDKNTVFDYVILVCLIIFVVLGFGLGFLINYKMQAHSDDITSLKYDIRELQNQVYYNKKQHNSLEMRMENDYGNRANKQTTHSMGN